MRGPHSQRCLGPKVYPEVPDGGWGWAVALAFFQVEVCTYGSLKSLGVFLQDLMQEFGESNSRVSWVVAICVFVFTFTAPLSTMLSNRFGYQPVVMMGGFLISLGTISSAFSSSISEMYVTVGVVSGLGYCLTFLPTVTILAQYFSRRRALVTSVASSGESFAIFAFAPAFTALKRHIGWRYCLVVLGSFQASVIGCGLLLRPIIIQPVKEECPSLKQTAYELENERTRTSIKSGASQSSEDSGVTSLSASSRDLRASSRDLRASPRDLRASSRDLRASPRDLRASPRDLRASPRDLRASSRDLRTSSRDLKAAGAESSALMGWEVQHKEATPPTPVEEEVEAARLCPCSPRLLDFSVLKDRAFICYSLFGLFATLGFFAPQLYVIELSKSRGVEPGMASYMLSVMAVAEIVGRLSIGVVLNKAPCRKTQVLLVCVVLLGLVLVAFTVVWEFWGLVVCCALYGYFLGTVGSTHIPMLAEEDVVGVQKMSSCVGVYVFLQSFAGLAGPPLGGVLVDATQNYGAAFYSCAAGMGLSAVFLALVGPAKSGMCRRQSREEEEGRSTEEEDHMSQDSGQADMLEVDLVLEDGPEVDLALEDGPEVDLALEVDLVLAADQDNSVR